MALATDKPSKDMLALRSCYVVTVVAILTCAGCNKSKPESASQSASASKPAPLQGAGEVMSALQKKDYAGTVAALAQAKAGMAPDQRLEYNALMGKVRSELAKAAVTDESAKKAFDALRQIESGR